MSDPPLSQAAGLPRQQLLRAMVDWSWELLAASERSVQARLPVFAGGFGLAAAEVAAAGADVPAEVLQHLGALVDKSLVQFDDLVGRLLSAGRSPPTLRGTPRPRYWLCSAAATQPADRRRWPYRVTPRRC